jgi:ADP-ribose pyrophosphatase YjhB (NUDIX family)
MNDLQGVALLLFEDGDMRTVYMVRERKSKPHIAKHAGMLSVPMETMERGESPQQAVLRLMSEEVGVIPNGISYIGTLDFEATETTVAYSLHCYIAVMNSAATLGPHTDTEDVERVGWMPVATLTELGDAGRRELPAIAALFHEYRKR